MQRIDARSFDVRCVEKGCVHFVTPDGRMTPFDAYDLIYRDGLEAGWPGPGREALERGGPA